VPDTNTTPLTSTRLAELGFFLGSWEGIGEFHATPFGAQKAIDMRVTGSAEERGQWLMVRTEELATGENSTPLTARYLWGYDAAAQEFTAEWFDSNGGRATQRSAGWIDDTLVFLGAMTVGGFTVPLRDSFTRRGDAGYYHIGETDLGEGWITVDDETFTRVA
jgi:hypothetical protein